MYSHELQTCDWPRNVGCELMENDGASINGRDVTPRVPQVQQIQSHKFRFSSVPSAAGPSSAPSGPAIPAQIQSIPPPPELKVAPNPVITSRGQPKLTEQEHIAKVHIWF